MWAGRERERDTSTLGERDEEERGAVRDTRTEGAGTGDVSEGKEGRKKKTGA